MTFVSLLSKKMCLRASDVTYKENCVVNKSNDLTNIDGIEIKELEVFSMLEKET